MERGRLAGDFGRSARPGEHGLVLERDEECRRRCRGREDLDLDRLRRRLELWWPGLGRRERSSGERGARECCLEAVSLSGSGGGVDWSGGVESPVEDWTGGGGVAVGNGGAASAGDVIGGFGAVGGADGWEGGCLGKFSWKD